MTAADLPWPFTLEDPVRAVHFAIERDCPWPDPAVCGYEATARKVIAAYKTWSAAHPDATGGHP